jgi:predicted dehydrogenase
MIDAAKENDVKLMVGYRLHFEAANLKAIQLAESGKLGDLRTFASEFGQQVTSDNVRVTEAAEHGGGPLYDLGVCCINAARYLFRAEPTQVLAMTSSDGERRFRKTEEMASALLRFSGERIATFTSSFGVADISRYTLLSTKGVLTADPAYDYSLALKLHVTAGGATKSQTFPKRDQFATELIYFSDCILNNREPEPSGPEGLADVRVVQATYESARTGKVVTLPEISEKKRQTRIRRLLVRLARSQDPCGQNHRQAR